LFGQFYVNFESQFDNLGGQDNYIYQYVHVNLIIMIYRSFDN